MKTEIMLFELNRHKRVIRQCAEIIASLAPGSSNAYVMAIGKNNEPLWVVRAGDQRAAVAISWRGVRRVVICSQSFKKRKYEQVYLTSQKQMNEYMLEWAEAKRNGAEYTVTANNTQFHVLGGRIQKQTKAKQL